MQHATDDEFTLILLDADIGIHTEVEVAQKLRSALGGGVPPLVGIANTSASRAYLQDSGLFDAVLEEGFQRDDLRRVVDQFALPRLSSLRISAS
jgi:hypothetical protein